MGHKAEQRPEALEILLTSSRTWEAGKRERIWENGISLTLVNDGWNVGRCVDVSPARQVESPILGLVSVSWQGPREGTTGDRLVRGAHPAVVALPSQVLAPECKAGLQMRCPRRWWEVHLMESANCLVGRTTKWLVALLWGVLRLSSDTSLL